MDRKDHKDKNIEELTPEELMEFLDESNTYFIKDDKSGIVGNKKTGVMLDRRTGKTFSHEHNDNHHNINSLANLRYDFLDYQKYLELLNASDDLELKENNVKENKSNKTIKRYIGSKVSKNILNKVSKLNNKPTSIEEIDKKININNFDAMTDKEPTDTASFEKNSQLSKNNFNEGKEEFINKDQEVKITNDVIKDEENSKDNQEFKSISSYKDDKELLDNINSRFDTLQNNLGVSKSSENATGEYTFSSFEDDPSKASQEDKKILEISNTSSALDKFRSIMDFEDYLLIMEDEESILKSPFDEMEPYEELKVVVDNSSNNEDSFTPFDTRFDVEEIESHSVNNENALEEGMIPELNLNQSISKKVSIREVIKHKQKKKQEQKELQDKLFFETLDERIEEFKNYEENNIDSKDILNAINVDLNKINSSIKVEFQSLNKNRNKKPLDTPQKDNKDKFSLQTLLEDIYEENGESRKNLDVQDIDIDTIKKDLANNENVKYTVN